MNVQHKDYVPFRGPLQSALFLRLGITGDPDCNHEDDYHDGTEFPELIAAKETNNRKACEGQETKAIPNNVSCLSHPAVPGISCAELFWRSDIEQKVTKGGLQGIESKVQDVKRDNGEPNGNI